MPNDLLGHIDWMKRLLEEPKTLQAEIDQLLAATPVENRACVLQQIELALRGLQDCFVRMFLSQTTLPAGVIDLHRYIANLMQQEEISPLAPGQEVLWLPLAEVHRTFEGLHAPL